jgi:hypothetical protein
MSTGLAGPIREGTMSSSQNVQELPEDQSKIADSLLRNLLIVLSLAFAAEVLLRIFPSFLTGADVAERRWLEWLLVSLVGVSSYLVWNVAIWYRKPDADFKANRAWYQATAAKGPLVAVVVLLGLTNTSFNVGLGSTLNFGVNFGQASDPVLLVAAFLLGFYSRLALDLLGRIAGYIFGAVYDETYKQEKAGPSSSAGSGNGSSSSAVGQGD